MWRFRLKLMSYTPLLCFAISDFGVILSGPIPPTT
jgi:hypothetical protein